MALAQSLNELATANSNGLLNDDEYRLLRQSVFQQFSSGVAVPVEAPVVPLAPVHRTRRAASSASSSSMPRRITANTPPEPRKAVPLTPSPQRPKTSTMTNLLRRATGRPAHDPPTPKGTRPDTPSKRNVFLPRILSKKSSSPKPAEGLSPSDNLSPVSIPPSPSSARLQTGTSSIHHSERSIFLDVFDEDNLTTALDIRKLIAITEDEGRRLVEAFNSLETSTLRRLQKQNAHRLPTTTPANVNVLLQGREWREHRQVPELKKRHVLSLFETDGLSIRSSKTTLSQSRSITSLPKIPPISPLSPHFRASSINLRRKNSVSSESSSSQGTSSVSFASGARLGVSINPTLSSSRSTGHLPLLHATLATPRVHLKQPSAAASVETVATGNGPYELGDGGDDVELADIRKRRDELISRYTARLEFLRAKLKGAELHEKLLRK